MDYSSLAAVGLLVLGLALIVAEICIPSGGFILIFSICCILGSGWFAWQAWWASTPGLFWGYVACVLIMIPTTIGVALYILPRTSVGKRIFLEGPDLADVTPYQKEQEELSRLIGKTGKALTLLNPGGLVLVEGERMHAETRNLLLEPGDTVVVVAVRGNRLVVRAAPAARADDNDLAARPDEEPDESGSQPPDAPLDFDIPRS